MTFTVKEIEYMIREINTKSNHVYLAEKSYGGYRLVCKSDNGERTITKNKRYNKNMFGMFLSDLLAYLDNEGRKN